MSQTPSEAFKYTSLHRIANQTYAHLSQVVDKKIGIIESLPFSTTKLIFVDGFFRKDLSQLPTDAGVTCSSSDTGFSLVGRSKDRYVSSLPILNEFSAKEGVFVKIGENIQAGIIEIIYYTSSHDERTLIQLKNSIHLNKNSQALIIERYLGQEGAQSLTNSITEIQLDENAYLDHIKIQTESALTDHIGQCFITQAKNSVLNSHVLSYGAYLARNEVHTQLLGENANANLYGLFIPQRNQHMDQYTVTDHVHSHANSNEFYRGILSDNSRGIFNGKVIVRPDAQKTLARQSNNNLLLSSNAEIDTKPELQIYADDVQCSHGATVGQLDQQALFYMQARGVPLEEAKLILLNAFAEEVIQKISHIQVRDYLQKQLAAYLPGEK